MDSRERDLQADIGSWVKVREDGADEVEIYRISTVTHPQVNKVSPDNAMGTALLGTKQGDEITVDGPVGPIKFSVLEVGRDD